MILSYLCLVSVLILIFALLIAPALSGSSEAVPSGEQSLTCSRSDMDTGITIQYPCDVYEGKFFPYFITVFHTAQATEHDAALITVDLQEEELERIEALHKP